MALRLPALPYRAFRGMVGFLTRPDVTLIGVRNIPDVPCIACSNHPNREEILLGYRIFRRPVRILLQVGLFDERAVAAEFQAALDGQYAFPGPIQRLLRAWVPGLSRLIVRQIRRIGSIPVVREKDGLAPSAAMTANRHALRRAVRALQRGEVIGMAPEGGLSPDGEVGELQRGAAAIAWHFARRGIPVPILPIIFHGMRGLDRSLLGRGRLIVALGEPFIAERADGENRNTFLDRHTAELHRRLQALNERVLGLSEGELMGKARGRKTVAPPLLQGIGCSETGSSGLK